MTTRHLLLLTLLTACSDYELQNPGDPVALAPDISVAPEVVDFGEVSALVTSVEELTIDNLGNVDLNLESLGLQASTTFQLLTELDGTVVEPGGRATLRVAWSPLELEEQGLLLIASDDPDSPLVQVPVRGQGLLPLLQVDPDPIEFTYADEACEQSQEVRLANVGRDVLVVDTLLAEGAGYELVDEAGVLGSYEPGEERILTLSSTGSGTGRLLVGSNDPRGVRAVDLYGGLGQVADYVGSDTIVLETAYEGCPTVETVRFDRANVCGTGEVELTSVAVTGGDFELVWPDSLPHLYGAEDPIELQFSVGEDARGTETADLEIVFSGALDPLELSLRAEVMPAALQVLPDPVDLGTWPVGCEHWEEVELTNPTACPITIDELDLGTELLELRQVPALPLTLGTWESADFYVGSVSLPEVGVDVPLQILNDGERLEEVDVRFVPGDNQVEDRFARDGPWDQMDVFVYIDGSCSMEDDTRRLSEQSGRLVQALEDVGVEWQIGVLGHDDGCIAGDPITGDSDDPEAELEEAVAAVQGSHTEWGLEITDRAMSKATAGTCNETFLREGAGLRAIMVSDEPDQSSGSWSGLVSDMQSMHDFVRISAIAGDYPSGCSTAWAGVGYYEAVAATKGHYLSICEADWSEAVDTLGSDLNADPDAPYPLSEQPDLSTLVVEVEGLSRTDWTYDVVSNAISFDTAGAVARGEEVVISYTTGCSL